METNALTDDDAEFLLFAFDADLDTQIDLVPFGAVRREIGEPVDDGVSSAARKD